MGPILLQLQEGAPGPSLANQSQGDQFKEACFMCFGPTQNLW